ncbi:MAG: AMP-binding protein [Christensenellales bacterium]
MMLQYTTMGMAFKKSCLANAGKTALVFSKNNDSTTYTELWAKTTSGARALTALGLKKGDHIGIWANNCPEWLELIFAAARLGIVIVTFNTGFKKLELAYQLNHSDVKVLFFQKEEKNNNFLEVLKTTLAEPESAKGEEYSFSGFPQLKRVICFQPTQEAYIGGYDAFMAMGADIPESTVEAAEENVSPEDLFCILYTSGTTGRPKGAMLTHFNMVNNAYNMADGYGLREGDVLDLCLPIFHSFALTSTLLSVLTGTKLVMQDLFSPKTVLQDIAQYGVTYFLGVPTMYIVLTTYPGVEKYNFSRLKTAIIGGAPCPEQLANDIARVLGAADTRVGYGITECSPYCFLSDPEDSLERRSQTVGTTHEHLYVRIVDPDNRELPAGEKGELVIKGYNVMRGYYKDEATTARAIDAEGWFHTGDVAEMDTDGFIRIKDRITDMIIRGGENVYSAEVEGILQMHPDIKTACVVGVPDKMYGEEIFAFIISLDGSDIVQKVREYAESSLARFKVPKYIVMIDQLPLNASGKVQKFILRVKANEYVGR